MIISHLYNIKLHASSTRIGSLCIENMYKRFLFIFIYFLTVDHIFDYDMYSLFFFFCIVPSF